MLDLTGLSLLANARSGTNNGVGDIAMPEGFIESSRLSLIDRDAGVQVGTRMWDPGLRDCLANIRQESHHALGGMSVD